MENERKEIPEILVTLREECAKKIQSVVVTGEIEEITTRNGVYRACIYYPENWKAEDGKLPVYFDFHGGGFVKGFLEEDEPICRYFCDELKICVIGMDYGLAPEHPWPEGVDDVYDMISHFVRHADEYKIDTEHMAIGGHSAGANLAAVTCLRAKETGEFSFRCQILDYPPLDVAKNAFTKIFIEGAIPHDVASAFDECYRKGEQSVNPWCSPVFATEEQLTGLPPAVLLICEIDTLREEAIEYAEKLIRAGVEVNVRMFLGSPHGFTVRYERPDAIEGHKMMLKGLKQYLV